MISKWGLNGVRSLISHFSFLGLTCIEICSGAGGQAIGLERAGFEKKCRESSGTRWTGAIRDVPEGDRRGAGSNQWEVISGNRVFEVVEGDVRDFSAKDFKCVDLLAGGVPCPPFSKAGKQLGSYSEEARRLRRNLLPTSKSKWQ